MAEVLINAKAHWMDTMTPTEISTVGQSYFDSRIQIGDIIVVRPDGWKWGKAECFPDFILVKIPGVSEATIKRFEDSLMDSTGKLVVKVCRYNILSTFINNLINLRQGVITITNTTWNNNLVDKSV